jgi:hypothetical protein
MGRGWTDLPVARRSYEVFRWLEALASQRGAGGFYEFFGCDDGHSEGLSTPGPSNTRSVLLIQSVPRLDCGKDFIWS